MDLSEKEIALILESRAKRDQQEAADAFQKKAVETALAWIAWSKENGDGLTFSTFVNQFDYQDSDGKQMFHAVERILNATLPD